MKKSLLLIIADDLYFQSSFLKKFSEQIGNTEYFIKDIVILKSDYKNSSQQYLLNNFFKLKFTELFKLSILKFFPKIINCFLNEICINISINKISKNFKYNLIKYSNLNNKNLTNLIKKKNYNYIINTASQIYKGNLIKAYNNKIINVHLSLLPKYAGVWTMFQQMSNNEKYTGVTIHKINSKIDSGDMILQKKIFLNKDSSLFENQLKCYKQVPILLIKCLQKNFKSIKKLKTTKIYKFPNDDDWKNFRYYKKKII